MTGRKQKLREKEAKEDVKLLAEKEVSKEVGIRLKKFREYLGKDLETFAEETQTEQSIIDAIENGDDREIGPYLMTLSTLYNVNLNWIICGIPPLFYSKGPLLPEIVYLSSLNVPFEFNTKAEEYIELCRFFLLLNFQPFKKALLKYYEGLKTEYAEEYQEFMESKNMVILDKITIDSTGFHESRQ